MAGVVKRKHKIGIPITMAQHDENIKYCRDHPTDPMSYNPHEDRWECDVKGCGLWLRRPIEFGTMFGGVARPAVYRGAMEVILDEHGKPYLYLVGCNGLIDLSQFMKDHPADDEAIQIGDILKPSKPSGSVGN